jgi:hypothetical protein
MSMMRTPSSGRRERVGEGRKLLGDFMVMADENGALTQTRYETPIGPAGTERLASISDKEACAQDWDDPPQRRNRAEHLTLPPVVCRDGRAAAFHLPPVSGMTRRKPSCPSSQAVL